MHQPLSLYARRKKAAFFLPHCRSGDAILEVGSGNGWWVAYMRARGYGSCTGLDLHPPADIVGDIRQWRTLGISPASFDVIACFEVLEHVECMAEMHALLRDGGLLFVTTPISSRDWMLRMLELLHLSQRRTSPHNNLRDIRVLPGFTTLHYRRVAGLAQWGVFRKSA